MNNTALSAAKPDAKHMKQEPEKRILKIRLMGTKNDIHWFQKFLQKNPKVTVEEVSELYTNKGTNRYYRAYMEVSKSNIKGKRSANHV